MHGPPHVTASQTGIGGILYQPTDDENTITATNIVGIVSKQLNTTQLNYPVYKKELWAVIYCLRKFHTFLWGRRNVLVITDHKPLIHILGQKLMTVALQQWLDVILDYDLTITYRPGILHVVPDALSRMFMASYNDPKLIWGTHNNITILKNFVPLSQSDILCTESLNAIKPMSNISKRHRIDKNMSGGGEYDDIDTLPQASMYTHTPTVQYTPPPVRTYTDTDVDDHTVSDAYICGNNIIADTVMQVHAHAHDAVVHPLVHNISSIMHDNYDELNDNNDGPLFDSYMCTTHPDGQPFICTLSTEEKLLIAQAKRGKRVPPLTKQKELLDAAHAQGHFGEKAMYSYIDREGYWWPRIHRDIADTIATCTPCRQFNAHAVGYHPSRSVRALYPGDHYMTDLAQFSTPSCEGHHYCLVCVDVFTGFIMLKALIDKKAPTVARALWEIFSVIGIPKILQSDGGSEFKNAVLAALTHLLGVPQRFISAYNPRSNGKVERSIRTIKTTVMKLLHGANIYWHLHLPFVQYAYNDKVQSLTGSTPFSLMYARNTNAVNDASRTDNNRDNDNDTASSSAAPLTDTAQRAADMPMSIAQWKQHQADILALIYPSIASRAGKHQTAYNARLDKAHRQVLYNALVPGTVVMIKDPKYLNGKPRAATEAQWIGPYTINKRTAHGPYIVTDELGATVNRTIPVDQMFVLYSPDHVPADAATVDDDKNVEVVSKIINHRFTDVGELEYHIQWKKGKPTWEKGHKINDPSLVAQYFKRSALSKAEPHTLTSLAVAKMMLLSTHRPQDAFIDNNDYVEPVPISADSATQRDDENNKVQSHSNVNNDANSDNNDIVVESAPVAPAPRVRRPVTNARIPDPHALTARRTMRTCVTRPSAL